MLPSVDLYAELFEWMEVKEDATIDGFGLELDKDAPEEMIALFAEDREIMQDMAEMVNATLNKTFVNDETKDEIDAFASKNMFYLFQAIIEQNMPRMNKKDMTKAQKIAKRQKFHDESVSKNKKSE